MKDFKKSVVYQIYPKSFNDTNGDGLGDLKGITVKLDYLKTLGVDYIWLTPFYISPQKDNGYDVADYCNIDPLFGTMGDFENLVREANKRGIDVMLDMVFNHTSTEHKWFKNALSGDKKYKNYYIFKEPKNEQLPTNWESKFGGSAWEYVKEFDEYYLHLFDTTQADLNWENEEVRKEIFDIVNFWIKKGVKGFRFDVINLISKPMEYKDDNNGDGRSFYTDGPNIHNYIKQLNKETFGRDKDIITVGEMSSTTIDNCIKYSNPKEEELSMVFNFHHLKVDYKDGDKWSLMDFDFIKLKNLFNHWQVGMEEGNAWNAVFWCNHDQPRIVSRFGDDNKYHKESAKMLATSIHLLRGTPYIYQGEEIGMTNCYYDTINSYRDVESINFYNILKSEGKTKEEIIKILQAKSRDNSRSPMQWDNSGNAGFTKEEPWIEICKNYKSINVENSLKDKDSIFYHYQTLIRLRKEYDIISYGNFELILEEDKSIFAYLRNYKNEKLLVINNFYGKESLFKFPAELKLDKYKNKILISNYKDSPIDFREFNLRPYESIVYHLERK
ncbi:alpha,alpha-phosphotrehalase [Clostridium botulinum]|uniref:Alpha,alpha-phosphotrehalase n=1 Tax=Clostridium botulinum TaxID=1491 RepID=A0A846I0E6_CLOBO|nr:alpha,alpha-phosphotrehalase [Clostridium botulinum]AJE10559.1 alpha,alpha-phosphotrehalase [Clostridium botulinum CDC_1436]AXG90824.1 alpha,alpha-phosphotrehalase [Clostridium botulinum]EDT83889.1 alpha,alpha-phosphotrehalase [Clostridium botulinum Bf]MBY6881783.1 alpha,alpha-phosphotrehalase [Clostridium botulinum]NEZ86336.1 alpha,alpha-phosphotrehalase [Clostridium botulinum]